MKLLTAILFICFATLPLGAQTPATTTFRIISQCDSAAIVTAPLLQQDYVNDTRYLTEGENSLKLPVDKAFAAIAVITPDGVTETPVMLSASQRLVIGPSDLIEGSAMHPRNITAMMAVAMNFDSIADIAPPEAYADWRAYLAAELDSLLPRRLNEAFRGLAMPAADSIFVANDLKRRYFGGRMLTYVSDAERFYAMRVDNPPRDFYRFLNQLDYSGCLLTPLSWGLYSFCERILTAPALALPPIGESSVEQWQTNVASRLEGVIDSPSPTLLDLLAASAYLREMQLSDAPLTTAQTAAIAALPSGLASIVSDKSREIDRRRNTHGTLLDLRNNTHVDLDSIIRCSSGRPVVVDFWNTWCAPCIEARRAIEEIIPDSLDVITVADASSDPSLWRETTHHSRGTHILLSEAAAESVYGRNSIVMFPTLLLFDADRRPAGRMDGWHGSEALKNFVILPDKPTPAPQ